MIKISATIFLNFSFLFMQQATEKTGARFINQNGYSNCIELYNNVTRVVLEPNAGGRVLIYAYKGVNVLYIDSAQNGWTTAISKRPPNTHLCGGRFDIGPSKTKPNTDAFFFGKWKGEITGDRSATLTSVIDSSSGLQIVRDFELDRTGSHLSCTQTIINKGKTAKKLCHWGRTLVEGGGVCILPVRQLNRFPKGFVLYNSNNTIDFQPTEPNVSLVDGLLSITAPPTRPKFEMDDSEGWIAYITKTNRLFIKKFPVYANQVYGEITAANTSIWYNENKMCEVEPIGPWQNVVPNQKISFKEDWYLSEFDYPKNEKVNNKMLLSALNITVKGPR